MQYQLVNRESPNLLSMPGLVDSHTLRQAKTVQVPKINPESATPKPEVSEEKPKNKIGRPRKVSTAASVAVESSSAADATETPVKTEKGKKKLDISKSKIY